MNDTSILTSILNDMSDAIDDSNEYTFYIYNSFIILPDKYIYFLVAKI